MANEKSDETALLVRFIREVYVNERRSTRSVSLDLWPLMYDGLCDWLVSEN